MNEDQKTTFVVVVTVVAGIGAVLLAVRLWRRQSTTTYDHPTTTNPRPLHEPVEAKVPRPPTPKRLVAVSAMKLGGGVVELVGGEG